MRRVCENEAVMSRQEIWVSGRSLHTYFKIIQPCRTCVDSAHIPFNQKKQSDQCKQCILVGCAAIYVRKTHSELIQVNERGLARCIELFR